MFVCKFISKPYHKPHEEMLLYPMQNVCVDGINVIAHKGFMVFIVQSILFAAYRGLVDAHSASAKQRICQRYISYVDFLPVHLLRVSPCSMEYLPPVLG